MSGDLILEFLFTIFICGFVLAGKVFFFRFPLFPCDDVYVRMIPLYIPLFYFLFSSQLLYPIPSYTIFFYQLLLLLLSTHICIHHVLASFSFFFFFFSQYHHIYT